MAKVLIIDDDSVFCKMFCLMAGQLGHKAVSAQRLHEGLQKVGNEPFDVVFLDVQMPEGNGLVDGLPQIRESASCPEVIIITGFGSPDGAELAIRNGAWDYVEKPASLERMMLPLLRASQYREEKACKKTPIALKRCGIVGNSPSLEACLNLVAQAAASDANVLIKGETGTGKELIATAIHENSSRAARDFVVVDCAALPESLIESMLFGHRKGAFTGATQDRDGLIKRADGGTLLLDEVGELPFAVQKTFLRVLHERRFRPIGAGTEIASDFRLIAASNRDLFDMVKAGDFREDLFFRLQTITLVIPPLRARREDIRELVLHHVSRICGFYRIDIKGISPDFIDALESFEWPGNVRELISVLERTITLTHDEPTLYAYHLPLYIRVKAARSAVFSTGLSSEEGKTSAAPAATLEGMTGGEAIATLQEARETAERHYLKDLIRLVGRRDIDKCCALSGLSRARFYQLLKKYDLLRPGLSGVVKRIRLQLSSNPRNL
jgi:two-component system NtrC family response regulator